MLEIHFSREMNHNYMIVDSPKEYLCGYECRMLAGNRIEGLLKFRIRYREEKQEFYYEITSKQPLKRLYDKKTVKGGEIRKLLLNLSSVLNKTEEYLLREEQILLDPEYIYVDPDTFSIHLCMVPGYSCDFPEAVTGLLRFLLEKVDHQDRDGVVLAYNLYQESLKENYGMPDLLRYLERGEEKIFGSGKTDREETKTDGRKERPEPAEGLPDGLPGPKQDRAGGDAEELREYRGKRPQRDHDREHEGMPGQTRMKAGSKRQVKRLYSLAESALLTAGGLAALWFFAGEELFFRFGPILGPLLLGLLWLPGILLDKRTDRPDRGEDKREEKNRGWDRCARGETESRDGRDGCSEQKGSWRITFEEETPGPGELPLCGWGEAERENNGWEEDAGEKSAEGAGREVETELLVDLSARDSPAVLESLSRDRENIEVAYVPFIIGKHADMADFCLKQPTVSRLHLRIDRKEGVYIVTDLNTTNGTTVDGYHLQANETVSIKDGDLVYLADIGYRFLEKRK